MSTRAGRVILLGLVALAASGIVHFGALPARAADAAWEACSGDDPDASIAGCTEVLARGEDETDEDRATAHYNRGNAHYSKQALEEAIADYDAALELNPDHAFAHFNRGGVHTDLGDNRAALDDYTAAIALDPTDAAGFYNRGNAYKALADTDKAITDFNEALRLKPDYANAYFNRGNAYCDKSDYTQAVADYSAYIALDSTDASAYRSRANAFYMLAEYAKAIVDYDASLAIEPDNETTKSSRADAVAALEEPAEVEEAASGDETDTAALTPAIVSERRVALVIGNSDYSAVGKLANPPRDADALAGALRDSGFAEVTVIDDAGRDEFIDALNAFADSASGADWAVVYYAGHGIEMDGINYLIPIDASLRTDRDIGDEAIALDRVIESVEGAKKLRLVILDACRNNPFVPSMRMTVASRAIHRGLARVEPEGGTLVAYAAKGGQEAIDGEGDANSPFAAALVERLRTPGLEVGKLFRLVRDDVLAATARKQEPFIYGSLPGEDFFFRPN